MSLGVKNVNFSCVIWTKETFFCQSDTSRFLNKRWTCLLKSAKEVSLQIKGSESTKSGREKLIFSRFEQKQLQIHVGTENKLNMLSHRLLGLIIRGTKEIHSFFISNVFFQLSLCVAYLSHELSFKCCLGVA